MEPLCNILIDLDQRFMEKDHIKIKSETGIKGLIWDKARTKEVNMQDAWTFLKKKMGQQIINIIFPRTDRTRSRETV